MRRRDTKRWKHCLLLTFCVVAAPGLNGCTELLQVLAGGLRRESAKTKRDARPAGLAGDAFQKIPARRASGNLRNTGASARASTEAARAAALGVGDEYRLVHAHRRGDRGAPRATNDDLMRAIGNLREVGMVSPELQVYDQQLHESARLRADGHNLRLGARVFEGPPAATEVTFPKEAAPPLPTRVVFPGLGDAAEAGDDGVPAEDSATASAAGAFNNDVYSPTNDLIHDRS